MRVMVIQRMSVHPHHHHMCTYTYTQASARLRPHPRMHTPPYVLHTHIHYALGSREGQLPVLAQHAHGVVALHEGRHRALLPQQRARLRLVPAAVPLLWWLMVVAVG